MKILIYSDLHISRTSSILPASTDSKYTYRQQMILKTAEFLENVVMQTLPDLIINCGDTFDQHTITSYDVEVASQFFSHFDMINIPHLVLVGNHEMINENFNAIALLDNISNIKVISQDTSINSNEIIPNTNIKLAFLPYCDFKSITSFPEGDYLFSHQDIAGSCIRGDFKLPDGLDSNVLKTKYKLVFNGHIHKSSIFNNVINVGSITTHSFSDDENTIPQCYLFDTDTNNLTAFKSNCCPLFRHHQVQTVLDLTNYLDSLDKLYTYVLHITCPYEIKEEVKQILSAANYIVNSRITVKIENATLLESKAELQNDINLQSNIDIKHSFTDFLNTITIDKYPKNMYLDVLKEVE